MSRYNAGKKIIKEKKAALKKEIDDLKFISPVYTLEKGDDYNMGLLELRRAYAENRAVLQPVFIKPNGDSVARPMSFEETIDALVNDYESEGRILLDSGYLSSCTGIIWYGYTPRFKVVPVSSDLILLNKSPEQRYLMVDYDSQDGIELNATLGKYNTPLTKLQVLNHPGWRTLVSDRALLKAFRDIVFAELKTDLTMKFHLYYKYQTSSEIPKGICPINLCTYMNGDYFKAVCVDDLNVSSTFVIGNAEKKCLACENK